MSSAVWRVSFTTPMIVNHGPLCSKLVSFMRRPTGSTPRNHVSAIVLLMISVGAASAGMLCGSGSPASSEMPITRK